MHDDERLNRAVAHVAAALRTPALLKLAQVIFAQLHAGTGRITMEQLRSGLTKLGVDFAFVNAGNGNGDGGAARGHLGPSRARPTGRPPRCGGLRARHGRTHRRKRRRERVGTAGVEPLARDVEGFFANYDNEVTALLEDFGYTGFLWGVSQNTQTDCPSDIYSPTWDPSKI